MIVRSRHGEMSSVPPRRLHGSVYRETQFGRIVVGGPAAMSFIYDASYHLHCQFVLKSGRTIILEGLHQEMTYAGQIEGIPNAESNDRHVEATMRTARSAALRGATPHLIPPRRRDYLRMPGDMAEIRSSHHLPEWLPMVTCVGSFKDVQPVRDHEKHLSVLTVVWYQDEYAPPILEPALGRLLGLDWQRLAEDIEP